MGTGSRRWFATGLSSIAGMAACPHLGRAQPDPEDASQLEQWLATPAEILAKIEVAEEEVEAISRRLVECLLEFHHLTESNLIYRGERMTYLRMIVSRLATLLTSSPYYQFIRLRGIDIAEPLVCAFPNGVLLVSFGLIDASASQNALAGVLAHELAHLEAGDLLNIPRALVHHGVDYHCLPRTAWLEILHRPFTAQQEVAADSRVREWLVRSGWSSSEYAQYLNRREEEHAFAVRWFRHHTVPGLFWYEGKHRIDARRLETLTQRIARSP
ncbi:MAG: hypothetical protein KatS3mg111_0016 [Pirellulaceae bacterium]|nr:MAG: hypothetical protein KatS3mg111_0016 [Pirellulaceae bacterium]